MATQRKLSGKEPKQNAVADSWEDEADSSSAEESEQEEKQHEEHGYGEHNGPRAHASPSPKNSPSSSPPTNRPFMLTNATRSPPPTQSTPDSRPEKTDATARRLIMAGLGLKAPKRTEEQKAYDKAVREQERKRRDRERLDEQRRKEEAEQAKAAIWDD